MPKVRRCRRPRLLALIAAAAASRVVVFGDLIADEYVYGRVARVSREAPVLILEYDSTEIVPGGAGNAANNVAASAARARWCRSSAATSRAGGCSRRCRARVERAGASCAPAGYRTPVKTRILAGGIHSAKQQVVRIDRVRRRAGRRRARARRSSARR